APTARATRARSAARRGARRRRWSRSRAALEHPQDLADAVGHVLRERCIVVVEAPPFVPVHLDDTPRTFVSLDRDHQQRIETELLQELHLILICIGITAENHP